jgi:hypothetical protein
VNPAVALERFQFLLLDRKTFRRRRAYLLALERLEYQAEYDAIARSGIFKAFHDGTLCTDRIAAMTIRVGALMGARDALVNMTPAADAWPSDDKGMCRTPWAVACRRLWRRSFPKLSKVVAAAVILLCIGISFYSGDQARGAAALKAKVETLEAANSRNEAVIRQFNARLALAKQVIDELRLESAVTSTDLDPFTVVEGNRLVVEGSYDPLLIEAVRVRWGGEAPGEYTDVGDADIIESQGSSQRRRFRIVSPAIPRKAQPLTAELEFMPKANVAEQFPLYFTPARMKIRRMFGIGKDGQLTPGFAAATINVPMNGGLVREHDEIDGDVNVENGWPVVFVKGETAEWWPQAFVDNCDGRTFRAAVRFGEPTTAPGTKFRVVVLVAGNKDIARSDFKPGEPIKTLPLQYLRSREITVFRE